MSKPDKQKQVEDTLTQLYIIQEGKHPLSGKYEQGRLANVKKDLETFVLNTAIWESDSAAKKQVNL